MTTLADLQEDCRKASLRVDLMVEKYVFVPEVRELLKELRSDLADMGRQQIHGFQCAACIQDARNAEAAGQPIPEIHPAATVINGNAICDAEGRHRIVTPQQAMAQQASGLLIPQAGAQLPPMNGFGQRAA